MGKYKVLCRSCGGIIVSKKKEEEIKDIPNKVVRCKCGNEIICNKTI